MEVSDKQKELREVMARKLWELEEPVTEWDSAYLPEYEKDVFRNKANQLLSLLADMGCHIKVYRENLNYNTPDAQQVTFIPIVKPEAREGGEG